MSSEIEQRLRRLEDLEEIRALFQEYARHLDDRDLAAYSSLFAEGDGTWLGNTGRATGPAQIQAMLEERLPPNPPAPGPTHYHLVTNPEVELLDDGSARARTTWVVVDRSDQDEPHVRLVGHYLDTLIKRDGRWRFLRREAHTDIPYRPLDS
jgi:uncharacterized protein (TIGR02246 family)